MKRLDRLIGKFGNWGKKSVRARFESGLVRVNGELVSAENSAQLIGTFDRVQVGEDIVQARVPRYVMLNKGAGIVSATTDPEHKTVIDLIDDPWAKELHLAGRLDRFTTGLMILTNDSRFSEKLTAPEEKIGKRYHVTTEVSITSLAAEGVRRGMWLEKEQIRTSPAQLKILEETNDCQCHLTIYEGKHHQIKRLFARYEIKVIGLHRMAMGAIELDRALAENEYRMLNAEEVNFFHELD